MIDELTCLHRVGRSDNMSVDISFPLEFVVEGAAISLQASPTSREGWKNRISEAARPFLPQGHFATTSPIMVCIYYFPGTVMQGDIDNIIKPILDALNKFIYVDDRQVQRRDVRRYEPGIVFAFDNPSPTLASAIERDGPCVYIKVDDTLSQGEF